MVVPELGFSGSISGKQHERKRAERLRGRMPGAEHVCCGSVNFAKPRGLGTMVLESGATDLRTYFKSSN